MSDNYIIIIPEDPSYIPSASAQEKALQYFQAIAPHAEDISVKVSDSIRLVDCGANLETISCPACSAEIDLDWWRDTVEMEYETGFSLVPRILHCCEASKSLSELIYDWPQGFARFSLDAMNPGISDLEDQDLAEFANILGCKTRKILQHL